MSSVRLVLTSLAMTLAQAQAQTTYIVDRANGPGTNFTDLPAAVAVALDGDTIVLRASTMAYSAVVVTRGITILGEGNPIIGPLFTAPSSVLVTGLAANRAFAMKNVQLLTYFDRTQSALSVTSCAGRVHLERVTVTMNPPGQAARGSYVAVGGDVDSCAAVTLSSCTFSGSPALRVRSSTVTAQDCTIRGHDGTYFFFGYTQSAIGAEVSASTLTLVATAVAAGQGQPLSVAQPAMIANGATLRFGTGASLAAGSGTGSASALSGSGTLLLDPAANLTPFGGAPPIGGSITVTPATVPSMSAGGAPPGGIVQTTTWTPANDLVVLFASLPMLPLQAPPFGELWLDPLAIFYVAATYQGPGGRWDHPIPIGPLATRGLAMALQVASGPGLNLQLSTPCVVLLD